MFFRIYHYAHLLSLDVALGAVSGMYFFATLFNVRPGLLLGVVLGLAVWVLYTLDHLRDTYAKGSLHLSERHMFHQQHKKPLFIAVFLAIGLGFFLVLQVEESIKIILSGIGLGIIILSSWVLIQNKWSWLKELSTSVFYVAGLIIGPLWLFDAVYFTPTYLLFIFNYILLAWINLLILSYLDADLDNHAGFISTLTVVSREGLGKFILWLGAAGVVLLLILLIILPSYFRMHSAVLIIMLSFHIIQFLQKDKITSSLIRKRLEAVFLLPYLLLLI